MKTSPQQQAANRQNARYSTGPTTPQGKARSAQNATRHGLTAQEDVMSWEDQAAYQALYEKMLAKLNPQDDHQLFYAEQYISCMWRIKRVRALALQINHENADLRPVMAELDRLSLYENRLFRRMEKAHRELKALQEESLFTPMSATAFASPTPIGAAPVSAKPQAHVDLLQPMSAWDEEPTDTPDEAELRRYMRILAHTGNPEKMASFFQSMNEQGCLTPEGCFQTAAGKFIPVPQAKVDAHPTP